MDKEKKETVEILSNLSRLRRVLILSQGNLGGAKEVFRRSVSACA